MFSSARLIIPLIFDTVYRSLMLFVYIDPSPRFPTMGLVGYLHFAGKRTTLEEKTMDVSTYMSINSFKKKKSNTENASNSSPSNTSVPLEKQRTTSSNISALIIRIGGRKSKQSSLLTSRTCNQITLKHIKCLTTACQ